MNTQGKTAKWLDAVNATTAFEARNARIGGEYLVEVQLFLGWVAVGRGRTVREAYADARKNPDYERSYQQGCEIRVIAQNPLGAWALSTDGVWRRAA